MRDEIEARFGLVAMNHYGLSEMMGPGVAQERADARGALTLWEDHFYPEVIDPATGAVLPDGEEGELRSDGAQPRGHADCALSDPRYHPAPSAGEGRAMRRIERIKGRSDDMLIIRGVNVFPSQIEAMLAAEPRLAPHYMLEVTQALSARRTGRAWREIRPDARPAGEAERTALEAEAVHLIKAHVGVSCAVGWCRRARSSGPRGRQSG